jgi:hypothetical protein
LSKLVRVTDNKKLQDFYVICTFYVNYESVIFNSIAYRPKRLSRKNTYYLATLSSTKKKCFIGTDTTMLLADNPE